MEADYKMMIYLLTFVVILTVMFLSVHPDLRGFEIPMEVGDKYVTPFPPPSICKCGLIMIIPLLFRQGYLCTTMATTLYGLVTLFVGWVSRQKL